MLTHQLGLCLYQLLFCVFSYTAPSTTDFTIAGLFGDEETLPAKAFIFAIEEANKNFPNIQLKPLIRTFHENDVLIATQQVNETLLAESVAVFGPKSSPATSRIRMLTSCKNVPHFETDFSYDPYSDDLAVYPSLRTVGSVVASMVRYYDWQSLLILYETEESLVQLLERFSGMTVACRQLPKDGRLYLAFLEETLKVLETPRIIVQASLQTSQLFLKKFIRMNITTEEYHFIFLDLDMYTVDLRSFKLSCSSCTVSGVKLVQTNEHMDHLMENLTESVLGEPIKTGVPTTAAVIYDSVMILAKALDDQADHLEAQSVSCHSTHTWSSGARLISAVKQAAYGGATGNVTFDHYGKRNASVLSILDLTQDGFQELGTWNEHDQLQVNQRYHTLPLEANKGSQVLRVTVLLEPPFVMLKSTPDNQSLVGNDRFEGFCIDLLKEIVKMVPFNYTIHEVADKAYGARDANGKWNGMVGELVRKEADLALAPLGINEDRSEAIDFTIPFMESGLIILYKKPVKKDPNLFVIFSPLSLEVWLCILVASIVVAITLLFMGRISSYECASSDSIQRNNFNLLDSFWFTVGSLMQQGSDIHPRAASTRIVAGFWWLFTLFLVSSYTANLAVFLNVQRMVSPITGVDDLVKQTKIRYGVLENSAQMTFFKMSTIPTYARMWEYMQIAKPSVFVNSTAEGVRRVLEEDYAFIGSSQYIEYYTERNCNIMLVGNSLYSFGYGLALPKRSLYRDKISAAILSLQEATILTNLKERWWRQNGGAQCQQDLDADFSNSILGLPNVAGAFMLLLIGLSLGWLVSIWELVYKARQKLPGNSQHVPQCVPVLTDGVQEGNDPHKERVTITKQ